MVRTLMAMAIAVTGCAGDDDGGGDTQQRGSCFYGCNTNFGLAWGCVASTSVTDATACDTEAASRCSNLHRVEWVATCESCGSSCAPSWHDP
jgi:nicotinamide mononucleotide (NMN) deamidase PncC